MYDENEPGNGPIIGAQGTSKLVVDSVIDGTVIVLAAGIPGVAPFIVGGATALKGVGSKLQEHQDRNVNLLMTEGQNRLAWTPADFIAAVTASPERLLPFVAACDAARRTALDEKVRALGRAVADLASDDALVDESTIWITIFSQVDAPHLRMINALCEFDPENEGYPHLWKRNELREKCGLTATVSILINTLTSLGLMREIPYADLDQHSKARWGANAPGSGGSPLYGKGPLTNDFLEKLDSANT